MSGVVYDVQAALVAVLRSDADVKAALGDPARIYDVPPREVITPLVVVEAAESRPVPADDGGLEEHTFTLRLLSKYQGAAEVRAAQAAMAAVIETSNLLVSSATVVNQQVRYRDCFRGRDGRSQQGVMRIRIVTEQESEA